MDFIVNYKLGNGISRYVGTLVSDVFSAAINIVEDLEKSLDHQLAPHVANELIKLYAEAKAVLAYAQATAFVVSEPNSVVLKFAIQNNKTCYNEVNSEQKRMWLRDLLDTCILHYIRIGLIEAKYDCAASGGDVSRYALYLEELEKALKGSHNKRTERFFIENE